MENQPESASIYSSLVLRLYDFWVLQISNTYAWRCSTRRHLLPFFKEFSRQRHLDVGVGTGFYPSKAIKSGHLFLLDSNPNCLRAARERCKELMVTSICHDVFQPFSTPVAFDSISLFYLLHCLPGAMDDKETVIVNLKQNLTPAGVLYGATILGYGEDHNWLGRKLMQLYNKKGVFGNANDTSEALSGILQRHFTNVSVQVIGRVALFSASGKT